MHRYLRGLMAMGLCLAMPVWAKTWVNVPYATPQGGSATVEAVLRKPSGSVPANGKALLILHHAGGFDMGTTERYAEQFSAQGYTTLELKMFDRTANIQPPRVLYAMMAGGLSYLANTQGVNRQHVSAMGLSLGAFMTVTATSQWFYTQHGLGDLRFDRLASVYPACWMLTEAAKAQIQGIRPYMGVPAQFMQQYARRPLLILAGAKDHYDGQDPQACPNFVAAVNDPEQAKLIQVKVYPDATHGWDHGKTYAFPVRGGCVGRSNCRNENVSSPETTQQGQADLMRFFSQAQ